MLKNLTANAGDAGSIPGSGRSPGEGNGNLLQYYVKSHGQKSLAGYSPWGCKTVGHELNDIRANGTFTILLINF